MRRDGAQCWWRGRGLLWLEAAPLVCCGTGRGGVHPGSSWVHYNDCELRLPVRREPGDSGGGEGGVGGGVG